MKQKLMNGLRRCKSCGSQMLFQGYNIQSRFAHIMQKEGICYECAYWMDIAAYPPDYMEVVGNICMRIYPLADKKDKSIILGGKGKTRYFMRPDLSLVKSNDIWIIGTIPERFKSAFKTTVVEIPINIYRRLSLNNKKCEARACFDRYHCIRYDIELENNENGAFNTVPANWKLGGEHCKYFINKQNILTDESSVIQ